MKLQNASGGSGGSLKIGNRYMGGVIFYLKSGGQHGMVVSIKQTSGFAWGSRGTMRYTKQG